jgi:putative N6-adenine-specific DNA methylase
MINTTQNYIAKTTFGLEEILAQELKDLGAIDIKIQNRAVAFSGDKELLYKVNYCSRTALRVFLPLVSATVLNETQLYDLVKSIAWEDYLDVDGTLAVDSTVHSETFNHSQYVALKTKDAIVDRFREKYDRRPSVDVSTPDLRIHVHIDRETCSISLDSSGEPLFKRGYRVATNEAPLNEVLAAGLIYLSNWNRNSNFIDGMCGSGTILIEAAMFALNIPPQIKREHFGFLTWNDFDVTLWKKVKLDAINNQRPFKFQILGSDLISANVRLAQENIANAGLEQYISVRQNDFLTSVPPEGGGILVMNPPYGERMSDQEFVETLYKQVGDTLKKSYAGFEAWMISSNREALKKVGLKPSRKIVVFNGSLECRFQNFSLYAGTKRTSFKPQ